MAKESPQYKSLRRRFQPASQTMAANQSPLRGIKRRFKSPFQRLQAQSQTYRGERMYRSRTIA